MTAYHLTTALVPALAYQLQLYYNTFFHFVSKSSHRKLYCVIRNTLFEKGIFRTTHSFLYWSCSSLGNNSIVRIRFFLHFRRGSHLFLLCLFQIWNRRLVNLHLLFLKACRFLNVAANANMDSIFAMQVANRNPHGISVESCQ